MISDAQYQQLALAALGRPEPTSARDCLDMAEYLAGESAIDPDTYSCIRGMQLWRVSRRQQQQRFRVIDGGRVRTLAIERPSPAWTGRVIRQVGQRGN